MTKNQIQKEKVLLIYTGKKANVPRFPLSTMVIASYLRKNGYIPEILDTRVQDYQNFNFRNYFCIGISAISGIPIKIGIEVAKLIRKQDKKIPIIWGGIHVSLFLEESLKSKYVDAVIKGEGELAFLKLLKALKNKENIKKIWEEKFIDLNSLELPSYDLIDLKKYASYTFDYETSRGCPNRCGFCYNKRFHKRKWRAKNSKKVLEDLTKIVNQYDIRRIEFTEDNCFVNKKRILKICNGIINKKLNIKWRAQLRADSLDDYSDKEMQLLRKSGCYGFHIGGESSSQRLLDLIQKDITTEQILNIAQKCSNFNIATTFSFMVDLPTETKEELYHLLDFCNKLRRINKKLVCVSGIYIYVPYPKTDLYEKYNLSLNLKTLEDWGDFRLYADFTTEKEFGEFSSQKDTLDRKKLKIITIIARYRFFMYKLQFLDKSYLKNKLKTPLNKFLFVLFNPLLKLSAKVRWKSKFFGLAYEWKIYNRILNKIAEVY